MKKYILILIVFLLLTTVSITYCIEGDVIPVPVDPIETVKTIIAGAVAGMVGTGAIGAIAYGLLKKTKDAITAKVAEAKAQSDTVQASATDIYAQLKTSQATAETQNILLVNKFDAMKLKFTEAQSDMAILIAKYNEREVAISAILSQTPTDEDIPDSI